MVKLKHTNEQKNNVAVLNKNYKLSQSEIDKLSAMWHLPKDYWDMVKMDIDSEEDNDNNEENS